MFNKKNIFFIKLAIKSDKTHFLSILFRKIIDSHRLYHHSIHSIDGVLFILMGVQKLRALQ